MQIRQQMMEALIALGALLAISILLLAFIYLLLHPPFQSHTTAQHPVQERQVYQTQSSVVPAQRGVPDVDKQPQSGLGDTLTLVFACVITAIFGLQLVVFGMQGNYLRQTIEKMGQLAEGQSTEIQASIAQAARAAVAMDHVGRQAEVSATAAARTVGTMREFMTRHMRAYVFVHTASIHNVADPPDFGPNGKEPPPGAIKWRAMGPVAVIVIRNSGHTPAHDVVHWGHIDFRDAPLVGDLPTAPPADAQTTRSIIPPGASTTKNLVMPAPLTVDQIVSLRNGTAALYVYGAISYVDAFGARQVTNYSLRHNALSGVVGVSGELTGTYDGNTAT
jgi:hypothetical protein